MGSDFINYNLLRFLLVFKVHSSLYSSFSVNIEVHLMGSPGNMCQLWRECVAITVSAIYLRFQYNLSIDQDIRHDAVEWMAEKTAEPFIGHGMNCGRIRIGSQRVNT